MIIISGYTLTLKEKSDVFIVRSAADHICPVCRNALRYRDSRIRLRKRDGGATDKLLVRRFRCAHCRSYHTELPDCLVPYKHYAAEVISGVLDGVVSSEDLDSEDYPSLSTMLRWLQWFSENLSRIEGYLRSAGHNFLHLGKEHLFSAGSLVDGIRDRYPNWLEQTLRLIYNGGGFLVPIRW